MSEWKEIILGEVVNIQNGYAFKSEDFDLKGLPVIKIKNIASGKLTWNDISYFSKSLENLQKFVLNKNDILIAMTGSHLTQASSAVGTVTKYDSEKPALLNQRVGKIIPNKQKIDNNFLYYFLIQPITQYKLGLSASGSANQANISPDNIKKIQLLLPSLEEQKAIAAVLSCLDAKIENLRKQNETLEKIAQTLFKHWFIDFEFPNEDGKPYKSSGGAMQSSELGDIPASWHIKTLKECLEHLIDNRGKTPVFVTNGIPALSAKFVKNGEIVNKDNLNYVSYDLFHKAEKIKIGDVIMTSEAPLGETYFIAKNTQYYPAQRVFVLRANTKIISPSYLYYWLISSIGNS